MKKIIVALLVILIPASLFAGFGLAVGGDINYAKTIEEIKDMKESGGKFSFKDFSFNAEARANLSFWEIDLAVGAGKNTDYPPKADEEKAVAYFFKSLKYDALLSTGLHFDIAKVARLGITVGEKLTAVVRSADDKLVFIDGKGEEVSFASALKKSNFIARITADARIGNILVGATATSDLLFSFDTMNKGELTRETYLKDILNATQFGVFVGIELF